MQRCARVVAVMFLFTLGGARTSARAADAIATLRLAGSQAYVVTDGAWLAWQDNSNIYTDYGDVYAMNVAEQRIIPLLTGPTMQQLAGLRSGVAFVSVCDDPRPGMDGPAYCGHTPDAYGIELATGAHVWTTSAPPPGTPLPAIPSTLVVWTVGERPGPQTIMARDISTAHAPFAVARTELDETRGVLVDGDRLLWSEESRDDAAGTRRERVLTMRVGDAQPRVLYACGGAIAGCDGATVYAVAGELLVYGVGNRIVVLNTASAATTIIPPSAAPKGGREATTDGRYVVWEDDEFATGDPNAARLDLQALDTQTGVRFPVAVDAGFNRTPRAAGGLLAWIHGMDDQYPQHRRPQGADVAYASLAAFLPVADGAPVDATWYPETGHALQPWAQHIWDQAGGLDIFGYPLTDEVNVVNGGTLQYTERQRIERHPELAGTPYEYQLGLLGVEDTYRRYFEHDYLDAFKRLDAFDPSGIDPACAYFPATGHQICGAFRAYWAAHGLEFGDAGVSERESLALFGYPISEPYVDADTGLTIQYFERACLEWHPENAEPYMVQLARLGAAMQTWLGW